MNNVVIFSMLLMIFLFNFNEFIPKGKAPSVIPLIDPQQYPLKIEQDNMALERAGQQWRWNRAVASASGTPEQQLEAWYNARLILVADQGNAPDGEPIIAVLWLAGQPEGHVFGFYPGQPTWVNYHKRWYQLDNAGVAELLPWSPSED